MKARPREQVSNDTEAAASSTQDIARSLLGGTLSITAAEVDNGSTDNWGIASLSLNKTEFSCSDIGDNQVILSATDKAGNIASASAIVKVLGVIPAPAVTVSGVSANTITLGYGPQAATLTATDSAPASTSNFAWTPGDGLSATNGASVQFVPTAAGTFAFNVQAVNQNGCSAAASVSVPVVDARCETDKVVVCKKTGSASNPSTQLCVSPNAVPAHLRAGAVLGACS